ncbi:MAG TPA: diguanylate cyclase [Herpetosiphonaceae bacterium]|nr:diguanylate cyclase [Herpetosiphonaceae bacterium]
MSQPTAERRTSAPSALRRVFSTLRGKTLLVIAITIMILLIVIYIPLRAVVFHQVSLVETTDMQTNLERVAGAIKDNIGSLNRTAGDYATWDETYEFVVDRNQEYLEQDTNDTVFTVNQLNLMMIVDNDGAVVFGKAFDRGAQAEVPVPPEFYATSLPILTRHESTESSISGVIPFGEYPLLVASRPIIKSDASGPIRGTLLMGRALDAELIAQLAGSTRLDVTLHLRTDPDAADEWQRAAADPTGAPLVIPRDGATLAGYQTITDLQNLPVAIVQVTTGRTIYAQARQSLLFFSVSLLIAGIVVGWVMLQMLERLVLAPVRGLASNVRGIAEQSDPAARVPVSGSDEVSHLARRINGMLAALELAQNNLRDWVTELENRNRDISLLNEMGDELQGSYTSGEAYTVIAHYLTSLFPHTTGCLGVLNQETQLIETVVEWEDQSTTLGGAVFTPDTCLALRHRQMYSVLEPRRQPLCAHVQRQDDPYFCLPMLVQGEALGMLHIAQHPQSASLEFLSEPKQSLALTISDHIALSLTNLTLRETLHNQAIRDSLTNLFNRRYLEEVLEQALQRAKRNHLPLGVMMLDVDHFKRINDTLGHAAGDMVLRELARFLQTAVRGEDVVCRYGGEEFALILPDAALEIVQQRAASICQAVRGLRLTYNGQELNALTISIGVAAYPIHGPTSEMLIRSADDALYAAKRAGRNQVCLAPPQRLAANGSVSRDGPQQSEK